MPDFAVKVDASNGLELGIRCNFWTITSESDDDLTDEDVAMWDRIELVLNRNAAYILQDEPGDDPDLDQ